MINVRDNNPYSTGYVLLQYKRLYRDALVYEPAADDKYHLLSEGDELDSLAYKYYGDSKYWWIIYDINVKIIPNPFDLPLGTVLIIPNLSRLIATQL